MAPSGLIVEGSNEQLHLLCVSQARLQIVREHYLLPGEAFRFLLIIPTSQSIQANEQYISSDTLTLSINVEPVTTQLDPTKDIQHNTNKKTWITPLQTTNVVGYNFQRCAIVKQVFIAEQEELTLVLETIIDCSINTECGEAILSVSIEGTQSQPEFDYSYYTNTASGQRTITNSTALMSNTDFLQVDSLLQNLQGITRQINSNAPIQIRRTLYMKLNCITPIAISVNPPVPITLHPSFIVSELDTSKIAPYIESSFCSSNYYS
ncbi:MAG: hypothetical protein EZS28_006565 [Streblomastix strix]|uniref:Uncharacterized protein n=1 Tax=Streblomastix strix TaxID=222440 RepID=A0A5J4WSL0_9EUKA|nr:MAG: hypothetical protein EZS28_006565 [Streblomastix strix]